MLCIGRVRLSASTIVEARRPLCLPSSLMLLGPPLGPARAVPHLDFTWLNQCDVFVQENGRIEHRKYA